MLGVTSASASSVSSAGSLIEGGGVQDYGEIDRCGFEDYGGLRGVGCRIIGLRGVGFRIMARGAT